MAHPLKVLFAYSRMLFFSRANMFQQGAVRCRAAINEEGFCRVTVHADSRAVLTCPDGSEEDLDATRDALSEQQVDQQCAAQCTSKR